ncbi:MAG TPA: thioredoxin domain-containing protein [Bryobacteraceae bacterium]|nr:thioredoxin domain-containing protein [Bryobacteraceae bacterium]
MMTLVLMAALALAAQKPLVEGNPSSRVRVVIYEDLQCPDCANFRRMLDEKLLPKYAATVAFEHRDFPLPKHSWARKAAIASRFFQEIDAALALKFRRYLLFNLRAIQPGDFNERLAAFARENGCDPDKAVAALDTPTYAAAVEADVQEGIARGVARTPTAFVNGAPFVETFTFEEISKAIDDALKQQ